MEDALNHRPPISLWLAVTMIHTILCVAPFQVHCDQEEFRTRHFRVEDGLSQSYVYDIIEDHDGMIWIATRDGLNMFDGLEFHVFRQKTNEENSIRNNSIDDLALGPDGSIWCSVGNLGVDTYDKSSGQWRHVSFRWGADGAPGGVARIREIEFDAEGRLWAATSAGLFYHDKSADSLQLLDAPHIVPRHLRRTRVTDLFVDSEGICWAMLSSTGPVAITDFGRLPPREAYFNKTYPKHGVDRFIGESRQHGELLAQRPETESLVDSASYFRVNRETRKVVKNMFDADVLPAECRRAGRFQVLDVEQNGTVWVAVLQHRDNGADMPRGILRVPGDGGQAEFVLREEWLPEFNTWSILRDRSGIIWIGSTNGLYQIVPDHQRFKAWQRQSDGGGLSDNLVRAVLAEDDEFVWVGTNYGLNRINVQTDSVARFHYDDTAFVRDFANIINEVYRDSDGRLLVGANAGLLTVDEAAGRLVNLKDGEMRDFAGYTGYSVWSLCRDNRGRLWVGTRSRGLILFDEEGKFLQQYGSTEEDSQILRGGIIWQLLPDADDRLWVAAASGLYSIDLATLSLRAYGSGEDMLNKNIISLNIDRSGDLWCSSQGFGIARYVKELEGFELFADQRIAHLSVVYGMEQDAAGRYWAASHAGLLTFDSVGDDYRVYSDQDGLSSREFAFKASAQSPGGMLYFGGIQGLDAFHPDSLRDNARVPSVRITRFDALGASPRLLPPEGDTVRVKHEQNILRFKFAALDYVNPAQNRHAYRLEGFHDSWVECGHRREAEFTNLDPGFYTLRVRGSNNDGAWNEAGPFLHLEVAAPFWMTWWFKLLVISAVVLLTAWLVWSRMRTRLTRNLLQRRLLEYRLQTLRLQMNPHFIFNLLSSIDALILERRAGEASESLAKFGMLVRGVLDSARSNTVPLDVELAQLRVYLDLERLRYDDGFDYTIDCAPGLETAGLKIPSMLIQPFAENAIKHGQIHLRAQGHLLIALRMEDEVLQCVVEDNGIGRAAARQAHMGRASARQSARRSPSLGMSLSSERLKLLNSTLRADVTFQVKDLVAADGSPGGTRIVLSIPLQNHKHHFDKESI